MKLPKDLRFVPLKYAGRCGSCGARLKAGRARPLVTIVEEGVVRRLRRCCGLLGPIRIETWRGRSTE